MQINIVNWFKKKLSFINSFFSFFQEARKQIDIELPKTTKEKISSVDNYIEFQRKLIEELKNLNFLDHLKSNKWKDLKGEDLKKLHKIVMTDGSINGLNEQGLSIREINEKINDGVVFSEKTMKAHIKAIFSLHKDSDKILEDNERSLGENGFFKESFIEKAKANRVAPIIESQNNTREEYLLNNEVKNNLEEIKKIGYEYENKSIVLDFLEKSKIQTLDFQQKQELLDEFLKINAHEILKSPKDYEKFNEELKELLDNNQEINKAVTQAAKTIKSMQQFKHVVEEIDSTVPKKDGLSK